MPRIQQMVRDLFGKEPHKGVNPGRSGRGGRGGAGRRAGRRSEGRAAARRDPAFARHRNPGRRVHQADRAQHHHSDAQERTSSRRRPTTSLRWRSRSTRASAPWRSDNRLLGVFQLGNIPPAPRGIPQIEVTFDIDANGILNVTAKDRATNNEQKITITSSSGLSKDEVDKMAKDAESHAADDRKQRDTIEARNRADAMVYNVEKTLKEHRAKVERGGGQGDRSGPRRDQEGHGRRTTRRRINSAVDRLTTASHKLAEAMYKASSQPASPARPRPTRAGQRRRRRRQEGQRQRSGRRVRRRRRQEVSRDQGQRQRIR